MTAVTELTWDDEMRTAVDRLTHTAEENYYNPYQTFEWPDHIDEGIPWMSADLMTVHGTEAAADLSPAQRLALSKWESIHFYSLNVHGIRDLMTEVVARIHTPGFEIPTPFFHHFLGEENEHMWFFAEFCLRYGGKIYPDRTMAFPREPASPVVDHFIVFSRILIFEIIVDYFNSRMAADATLPETIRAINRVHHQDESRHIAFGCHLVRVLFDRLQATCEPAEVEQARRYVARYIESSLHQMYSVDAYRDAGIDRPAAFRQRLLADPGRRAVHDAFAGRAYSFYRRIGVLA
ncbi:diiron oxygenase [Micromonospora sp. NPDC049374]|uniref:diiron oxygenase n=1 Tax=unclassified Micromonospora TaxID=2617518 RepID=UPI00342673E7